MKLLQADKVQEALSVVQSCRTSADLQVPDIDFSAMNTKFPAPDEFIRCWQEANESLVGQKLEWGEWVRRPRR